MGRKEIIAKRIKTMRLSRAMTQADLAKAINQSQASITMYESARREPDFETLEALADVFNVPFSSLVSEEEYPFFLSSNQDQPQDDEIRLLIPGSSKLPPERIAFIKSAFLATLKATNPELFEGDDDQ